MVTVVLILIFSSQKKNDPRVEPEPSATFSQELIERKKKRSVAFEQRLVQSIRDNGYLTATIHIALLGDEKDPSNQFRQPDNPRTNLVWGALYGIDTHFPNAAKWKRVYSDNGDDNEILKRSVYKKHSRTTERWSARGITDPFDMYVLAVAWRGDLADRAMQAPIRDAMCNVERSIMIDGKKIEFGGESVVVGYAGENILLDHYTDPIAAAHPCRLQQPVGIFYLCSRSAVVLHMPLFDAGFYSVLFTRTYLPPEAYMLNGIMDAILVGDLDQGFEDSAAAQYERYQKGASMEKAREIFIR